MSLIMEFHETVPQTHTFQNMVVHYIMTGKAYCWINKQPDYIVYLINAILLFTWCTQSVVAPGMEGASGLDALTSLDGTVGKISSFGSTTDTLSGSGFLGPILPLGSHGNMILTLIPNTPKKHSRKNQIIILILKFSQPEPNE